MESSASPIARSAARSRRWVIPTAVVPLALLLAAGADGAWLKLGALAWIIALAVKLPVMAALGIGASAAPAWVMGLLSGFGSSATELGIALLALARSEATPALPDILLFAAAAGSVEALAVLGWSLLVPTAAADVARWLESAAASKVVRHQFVLERSIAWFGHLGSRSLVALAFLHQVPWLGAVAVLTFALTDGVAAYEQQRGADWFAAANLKRYFRLATIMVCVELAVLVCYLLAAGTPW